MSQPLYYAMYTGVPPARIGAHHATIAPYGPFATADGHVLFSIQNEREWVRLCTEVLGDPDLAGDPRFATNPDRVAHRAELQQAIEAAFATRTTQQVGAQLTAARIASGAVNTVLDVLAHPQLEPGWADIDTPNGPIGALRPPVRISGGAVATGAVPSVGQHTDSILAELGLDPDAIGALRADAVI
jgi:itaconate CoA-transferase